MADIRRAVRASFPPTGSLSEQSESKGPHPLVLVALSGGPDSLALAAATAFEAPRANLRAGAVIIDHALQPDSAAVAERAATQAKDLGLDPVLVRRVEVGTTGGPEAAARDARYAALDAALAETGAAAILLGHTLDDQAETVLLGLARGSGAGSLRGMPAESGHYRRPLLGIRRATTVAACADQALEPWTDPQNADAAFARVRVRDRILPLLEAELGPGIAEALARTAEQLREDDDALDHMTEEVAEDLAEHIDAGISLPVAALAANPPALRHRLIRLAVAAEFGIHLTRERTMEIARLVTEWHGQGPIDLPGATAERRGDRIEFSAHDDGAATPGSTAD
jgi:tRNA(Ile)-lysidine synthase